MSNLMKMIYKSARNERDSWFFVQNNSILRESYLLPPLTRGKIKKWKNTYINKTELAHSDRWG